MKLYEVLKLLRSNAVSPAATHLNSDRNLTLLDFTDRMIVHNNIIRCDQLKNKSSRRVTYDNPCYSIGSKANSIYFLNDRSVLAQLLGRRIVTYYYSYFINMKINYFSS
jgi:hypothetical protein